MARLAAAVRVGRPRRRASAVPDEWPSGATLQNPAYRPSDTFNALLLLLSGRRITISLGTRSPLHESECGYTHQDTAYTNNEGGLQKRYRHFSSSIKAKVISERANANTPIEKAAANCSALGVLAPRNGSRKATARNPNESVRSHVETPLRISLLAVLLIRLIFLSPQQEAARWGGFFVSAMVARPSRR